MILCICGNPFCTPSAPSICCIEWREEFGLFYTLAESKKSNVPIGSTKLNRIEAKARRVYLESKEV